MKGIDVEKVQNCISRRTILNGEAEVLKELNDFMIESTVECMNARNFYKHQAWRDLRKNFGATISKRLEEIDIELQEIETQLKEEESQ